MSSKLVIPSNFGAGGVGIVPGSMGGVPSLAAILTESQALANAGAYARTALPADAAAGTATVEYPFYLAGTAGTVLGVSYVPAALVVADAANNATILIARRRAGVSAPIASLTTSIAGTGNIAAFVAAVAAALTNTALAAGDVLTLAITKAGTGVTLPAATLFVNIGQ
jgi:hypothetical protein